MSEDLREILEEAVAEVEKKEEALAEPVDEKQEVENTSSEEEDPEKKEGQPTDEEVKKEEPEPVKAQEEQILKKDKAPSAWTPSAREKWADIPKEVRDEIIRREEDSAKGVRKIQEETSELRHFASNLTPFIDEAKSANINPGEYIGRVMHTERELRNTDPNARFGALLSIADQYQIPLREVLTKALGPEFAKQMPAPRGANSLPPEVQRELEESRRFRSEAQRREDDRIAQEIKEFEDSNEFFTDVRDDMAALIQSGRAKDLKTAYDMAIWANPQTRDILQTRSAEDPVKKRQNKAAQADVSGKDPLDKGKKAAGDEVDSIENDLREAWKSVQDRV